MTTDEATKKFIEDSGIDIEDREDPLAKRILRGVEVSAKSALREPDVRSASRKFIRTGLGALAHESFKFAAQTPYHYKVDALSVYAQMNGKYGQDWWDWEPETVWETLNRDFGLELEEDGVNIIGALQTILNTNQAHEHWHVFEKVGHAFNGNHVDFSILQPLELDEIAVTLSVLNEVRPKQGYLSDIPAYIAASAKNSGVVYLPESFFGKEAQRYLDHMSNDLSLKKRVRALWEEGGKPETDAEDIQLRRLDEIREYLDSAKEKG